MLEDLGVNEEDYLFGDVGEMVPGALKLAEDTAQSHADGYGVRIASGVIYKDTLGSGLDPVQLVVL